MTWSVKPGDLVVFVGHDPALHAPLWAGPDPALNAIYTVNAVVANAPCAGVYLCLAELDNGWIYHLSSFRPVTRPSIESLRALLKTPDLEVV